MSKESFAIIGAGAVGSYYGARLVQGAQDVHFLVRSDYEALRSRGMQVRSCAGDFHLPAETSSGGHHIRMALGRREFPPIGIEVV